ncbi:hypothetical protein C6P92_09115 [Burkholderia multivorans]|uniref:Uncharacterized protein n=1 Tax=Burkholderia multivorans TaxID=87883 RepID=A0A8E2RZ55_9BURK|nr:hypothetical protein C6P76_12430 [Burkholderia multivorans]PRE24449.1 hypothetical protein C6P92_09115 [Burkholderia multivorans]PRE25607.1 hypothetical protein C6P79_18480 [Burkholderia multivorans]PRF19572.1 hypothetical protein C6Q03_25045 [Burkholderia multivorans]PRF27522.1 hypothetical protein C6P98_04170 [Burkholderia multivorans]
MLGSCAITVDVNGVTRQVAHRVQKLLISNYCARTRCATGYVFNKPLIRQRKRRLSTELRAPC